MSKANWIWQPHAGHFILGDKCKFVLNTYLGNGYLVSTVGELWNERGVREIHAKIRDPVWHMENNELLGDRYDAEYFKRFGYEDLGYERQYETMVFKARKSAPNIECCEYEMVSGDNVDFDGYKTAGDARRGHMEMCQKWSRKRK